MKKARLTFIIIFIQVLLFRTNVHSQTWQTVPNSPLTSMRFEDLWFIDANTGWVVEYKGASRILKTTDGGLNFMVQFSSPDSIPFRSVAFNNANLGWAGSINGHLFRTTDGGESWTRMDSLINPPQPGFCDMYVAGDSLFVSSGRYAGPANFVRSTDAGNTFQSINMSPYADFLIGAYFVNNNTGYLGGRSNIPSEGAVVLYTTDGGSSWEKIFRSNSPSQHIWYINPFGTSTLYCSLQSFAPISMFYIISSNSGANWVTGSFPSSGQYAEAIGFVNNMQKGWIACGNGFGIYQTTNGGANWTFLNFGQSIHSMKVINDTTVYACGKKIYKYTTGIIGIQSEQTTGPSEFNLLYQNFPNPFNPATTFRYYIQSRTRVRFEIYSVTGKFIAILFNDIQGRGEHKIEWNAEDLPSGIYFYVLMTDEGIYTGRAAYVK